MSPSQLLSEPWALLLLLPLGLWLLAAIRSGSRPSGPAVAALTACAALVVLSLAAPRLGEEDPGHELVLLFDASPSIGPGIGEGRLGQVGELIAGLSPSERVRRIAFGLAPVALQDEGALAAAVSRGLQGPTDLGRALDAASSMLPAGGRILLVSDGQQSLPGDPVAAAASLAERGIVVHALPSWPPLAPDIAVEQVLAPRRSPLGAPLPIQVLLSCRGEVDHAGQQVEIRLDGETLRILPLPGPCDGRSRSISLHIEPATAGRPLLEARRVGHGADLIPGNDRAGTTVELSGPPKVLWVGDQRSPHPVRDLLSLEHEPPVELLPERLSAGSGELSAYDLVVLDDVSAHRLVAGRDRALEGYVRGGGGLLVLGGPASFGVGGYPGTRLEALLPVSSDLRRAGGRMAVMLLIDKSGSMGGYEGGWERLLLAKETLRSILHTLGRPDDEVGVLGFDTAPVMVLPMTRVSDLEPEGLDTGAIQAGGGTDPGPAIRAAALELTFSRAPVRQVIAISDGRFLGQKAEEEVRSLVRHGIRFSAIGIGSTAQMDRLETLATLGRGGVTWVREARHLPRAVLRELLRASGRGVRKGPVPVEPGLDLADLYPDLPLPIPDLDAIDRTLPRQGASRWLSSGSGDPILYGWRRDAGMVVAFTSSPGSWTSLWADWPGAAPMWRAVIGLSARRPTPPWEARAWVEGSLLRLDLTAIAAQGSPMTGHRVLARITDPAGHARELGLSEQEPGAYRGDERIELLGRYRITFHLGEALVAKTDAVFFTPPELQRIGNDMTTLQAIVAAGGGRILSPGEPLPRSSSAAGQRPPRPDIPIGLAFLAFIAYLWLEARAHRSGS